MMMHAMSVRYFVICTAINLQLRASPENGDMLSPLLIADKNLPICSEEHLKSVLSNGDMRALSPANVKMVCYVESQYPKVHSKPPCGGVVVMPRKDSLLILEIVERCTVTLHGSDSGRLDVIGPPCLLLASGWRRLC